MAIALATTNPILTSMGDPQAADGRSKQNSSRMTLTGTIHTTGLLLALVAISAAFSWTVDVSYGQSSDRMISILEVFLLCFPIPFILVWLTMRNKEWSPITAPVSAVVQGILLGYASAVLEGRFPGIVIQAVFITVAMSFGLLIAYRVGIIRVTASFNKKLFAAICGVFAYYIANLVLMLLGVREIPMLTAGIPGVAVSIEIVVIVSLRLVASFDAAVKGTEEHYPKYMEWYVALGLTVTVVWLYIETLALISRSRKAEQQ
jgi:uncharacterized YccA/Bax inhibitor family protein